MCYCGVSSGLCTYWRVRDKYATTATDLLVLSSAEDLCSAVVIVLPSESTGPL